MTLRLLTSAITFSKNKFICQQFVNIRTKYCGEKIYQINKSCRKCSTTGQIIDRYSFDKIGQLKPKSEMSYKKGLYICGAILGVLALKTLINYKNNPGRNKIRFLNALICLVYVGSYFSCQYLLKKYNICLTLCLVVSLYCAHSIGHHIQYEPKTRAFFYGHNSIFEIITTSFLCLTTFLPLFGLLSPRIFKYFTLNYFTAMFATSATVICAENNKDYKLALPFVIGSSLFATNMYLARTLPFSILSLEFLLIAGLLTNMCGRYVIFNSKYGRNFDKFPNGTISSSNMFLYLITSLNIWCLPFTLWLQYYEIAPKKIPYCSYYAIKKEQYLPELYTTMDEDKEAVFYNYRSLIE